MRTPLPLAPLLAILAGAAAAQDPVRYTLDVQLEPEAHRLRVEAAIELPAVLRVAGTELVLSDALEIERCTPPLTALGPGGEHGRRYALETAPADGLVSLSYTGVFDFGLSDQSEEYTRGFRETRGSLGPEGVYLDGSSGWVPSFGEGLIEFELAVRAPAGWHVIAQGDGSSGDGDGRAYWSSGGALEQVYLVGGPLVVEREMAGAVEALVYLHERDEALMAKYLEATAGYLEMYRGLIGPYPYGKFALVENFWETGYGMPSFTLLGPQVIRFPFILHSSYPHEILHNWWGNSVFVDYGSGNWCEGLTAYMADHLIQEQRGLGREYRRGALQKYRNYVREGRDFPLSEFRARHSAATEAVGYGKALMVFHMLRRQLGDEDFTAALASFYRGLRGQRASWEDLRAAFEAASGEELGAFFEQWIERTGAPRLVVSSFLVLETPDGHRVELELSQHQPGAAYALEVPLVVETDAGRVEQTLELRERTQRFELSIEAQPLSSAVDPDFDLFRVLDPRETPPSIGQIYGEPSIQVVLPADAAEEERELYRSLVTAWETETHRVEHLLDSELEELPDGFTGWILGRTNRFASAVVDANEGCAPLSGRWGLALDGQAVDYTDHSFVVIARNPVHIERAMGWIIVEPAEALAGLIRKLPHYGKYSYLAFEGDEPTNVVKGQWSASGSPLIWALDESAGELAPAERSALAELPPVFSQRALMEHVHWLAAAEREGRAPGSAGLAQSADYIAEKLAAAGLEPAGDEGGWFQRFSLPAGPDGEPVECLNVVGLLRGSNADWSDQSIVLGAHYDHLGYGWPDAHAGDEGQLHPGADDNASGVAVLLELAKNLATQGGGPRNLVVVAFSAEESGLVGSRHFVSAPPLPLAGLRGAINLDTVGRLFDQPLAIHGTDTADEWQHIFRGCGFVTGVENKIVPGAAEGSDQQSFIERGIPAVQVFTGAHLDYHRPGDTPDKVDGPGLVKVATFVKEALLYLLEREEPLSVTIAGVEAARPAGGTGRRVSFGSVPDFAFPGPGVRLDGVVPDSPAAKAGLLPGDVILKLDGTEIADLRAFSEFLKTLEPGQEVVVKLDRDGAEIEKRVTVTVR